MSFLSSLIGFFGNVFPRDAEAEVAKRAKTQNEDLEDWPDSIVDLLKALKRPSDFEARRALAHEFGRSDYTGTEEENVWLHQQAMAKVRQREW